jgi:hypothetical protein
MIPRAALLQRKSENSVALQECNNQLTKSCVLRSTRSGPAGDQLALPITATHDPIIA